MGLGLLGRGVGDIAFLAENGAQVLVTDLKDENLLKESLKKLKKYKNIKYVLGKHRLEDFQKGKTDLIFKAAGVPLDSIYIKEARKNKIPIYMSAAFFAKFSELPIIGITGTRGKSTVTHLITHILKSAGKRVLEGGNIRGVSNLQLLNLGARHPSALGCRAPKLIGKYDFAVFELDSWQLQGFGSLKISPQIAVFTTFFQDHMNYYKNDMKKYFTDKANIFKFQKKDQKKNNLFVLGKQVVPFFKKYFPNKLNQGLTLIAKEKLPRDWQINLLGAHNQYNASLAVEVARSLGINDIEIKKALESFEPIPGRLEFLREFNGIKIFNDNNSTTPEATIAALEALGKEKNIILIMGGADKNLDMKKLFSVIKKYVKAIVLIPGTGTDKIEPSLVKIKNLPMSRFDLDMGDQKKNFRKIIQSALDLAKNGDIILFSPTFASFGMFKNEFDRGDQFVEIIKKYAIIK